MQVMGIDLTRSTSDADPGTRRAQHAIELIEEMRESSAFDWACGTLDSIYDQASQRGWVSEKQISAILNIKHCRDRRQR